MLLSKRDQAQIERRLVATLTDACETAKAEIIGFCWLTHEVDYAVFPSSLMVVWVFDTQANKNQASGQGERMVELTAVALSEADVLVSPVSAHVHIRKWKRMKRPEKMAAVQRASLRLKSLQKKDV